uniref:Fibrillar collagen NC1 domain-containing protein n=1 Tax=Timema monikensis TaxID=170555 RepID=A0A7R9E5S1_9NEOP|nr:unnamed protein product [Timema monikensis]
MAAVIDGTATLQSGNRPPSGAFQWALTYVTHAQSVVPNRFRISSWYIPSDTLDCLTTEAGSIYPCSSLRVTPDRDSNLDLHDIDSLVYCESTALDHAATEVGCLGISARLNLPFPSILCRGLGTSAGSTSYLSPPRAESPEEDEDQPEKPKKAKHKKTDPKEDLGGKFLDMYSSIYTMRQDLDRMRKPVGTRENPVRTCRDLFYGHPQFKDGKYPPQVHATLSLLAAIVNSSLSARSVAVCSVCRSLSARSVAVCSVCSSLSARSVAVCLLGWYWIDPNLGMADDAVYVYCNMTGSGETCVFPDIHSSQMPNIPWRKEGVKNDWYSNLRGGFKITYETIGVVQMTFLRLLSQDAYQNFTYTCINSAAWYNLKTYNHDMAIRLLGEDEVEFGYSGVKPNILVDGCKVNKYVGMEKKTGIKPVSEG